MTLIFPEALFLSEQMFDTKMKDNMNTFKIATSCLLFAGISAFAGMTSKQRVSKVALQQETNGTKIFVYTAENGGKWGTTGCENNDPSAIFIPAGSVSSKEWISGILTAKSTGQPIYFEYEDANCATQIVIKAVIIE